MIRALIILFFTCACSKIQAQVNIITTIAGKDTAGYCCDGESATNAKLNYPYSIWLDKFDNIFITDALNQRIRKIEKSTGIITTIAGTGVGGYSGDNGLSINAEIFLPSGIIIDTIGNIYFADAGNMVVRKIDGLTNIITTFAGNGTMGSSGDNGPAINAELNGPCGLCFDKFGNIIIADEHNDKIRKVDVSTGIITTIAGTGVMGYSGDSGLAINSELNRPLQVCIDSAGNVLISDTYNAVIRKIDISTGNITTIAGNGVAGYGGDNGPAANAEFYSPVGLYIDQQQSIFIADDENGAVRKIDGSTGIVTTVAGTGGIPGYSGDHGPATSAEIIPTDIFFDSAGNMFIADADNNCIRKVNNALEVTTINLAEEIKIYPNPATAQINVTSPNIIKQINISNILGQTVYSKKCNNESIQVNISELPTGIYLIKVNDTKLRKFVKE